MRALLLIVILSSTAAAAEPLRATLGDLQAPIVITFRGGQERDLVIRAPDKREVAVLGMHETRFETPDRYRRQTWTTTIDGTVTVRVLPDPKASEHVILVYDPKRTTFDERHVYGVPAGDRIEDREIRPYAPGMNNGRPDAATIARYFAVLDLKFFVYAIRDFGCWNANIIANEPLIVFKYGTRNRSLRAELLRANGEFVDCAAMKEGLLTATRPARVAMPPPAPAPKYWSKTLDDEEFLPLANERPRIAKYAAWKAKAKACSDKQWAKLDPDGRAYRYDLVTYDANGNVQQVESYKLKLTRRVDAACNLGALRTERDAIRALLAKEAVANSRAWIEATAKRF